MAERKEERQDFYRLMVFNRTTDEKEHYNPKHWHDLLEITVCLTGASEVWIDGREFRNKPGGVFVISPRTMHMVHGIPPVSEDTGYCLQINLRLLYPVMPQLRDIVFLPECEEKTAVQIIRLIQDIERLCETDPASVDIPATVISLVVLLCEKQKDPKGNRKKQESIMEILTYIREHFREDLSNEEIAAQFHVSSGHLNRLFRTILKQSVHSYLTDVRIEAALQDINTTNLSLTEICYRNGFVSHKSFIAEFRKRFFVSPSEYRKSIRSSAAHQQT